MLLVYYKENNYSDNLNKDSSKVKSDDLKINFALDKLGAIIIKKSKELNDASAILKNGNVGYMSFPCNKIGLYFIISLSEDIYITELSINSFQPFSSSIKKINLYYSLNLNNDISKWSYFGELHLNKKITNINFIGNNILLRYIKMEILEVYDLNYYYCSLTQVFVYGDTIISINSKGVDHINFTHNEEDHVYVENDKQQNNKKPEKYFLSNYSYIIRL